VALASLVLAAGAVISTPAGAAGVREADINLDESQRLVEALRSHGIETVLTRTTDMDVALSERARRGAGSDLLVSVHNNASANRGRRGSEVYAQIDDPTSQAVARRILDAMVARAGTSRRGVFTRPGENGDYYSVLRNSPVPAVIVEGAFVSNPDEARLLAQAAFRQRLADGIADGIVAHFLTATSQGPGPAPPLQLLGQPGLPTPPGLTATRLGPGALRLTWAPVLAAGGYEVWRDGRMLGRTVATQVDDGGLGFGGHRYEIRAILDVAGLRVLESASAVAETAMGRVVIDPGHGGRDPGAGGSY